MKSRGGDSEGSLQTAFIANVSFLVVADPTSLTSYTDNEKGAGKVWADHSGVLAGVGLDKVDAVYVGQEQQDGTMLWEDQATSGEWHYDSTSGNIVIDHAYFNDEWSSIYTAGKIRVHVTGAGASEFVELGSTLELVF